MGEERSAPKRTRRIAVTGLGAVSAWGWRAEDLWRGLASGRARIAETEHFDTKGHRTHVAAEVGKAPDGLSAAFPQWRHYSRADRFAAIAAVEACRQAGLGVPAVADTKGETDTLGAFASALDPEIGLFFGGSTAGMAEGEDYFARLEKGGPKNTRLRLLASHQLNAPGDAVARLLGITGPVRSFSSACASGALAIGAALDALRGGEIKAALCGGSDALCQLTYAGFNALRAVDTEPCRPFRRNRGGLSLGEGSGVLFIETEERAQTRGARPIAELLGTGASCDAHHMTAPRPSGEGAAKAVAAALEDASARPEDVGFINAHGTGTPLNDASEWRAIQSVFGDRAAAIPVTSTKGSIGHLLGSSGAIEAVATVQCLWSGKVHPTPGQGPLDEAFALDLVKDAPRPLSGECALAVSTSFGFGGANAALVFSGWPQEHPT